jgi:hypothetical protein
MYNLNDYTITKLKALPFHASTRLRLKNMGQIKDTAKKNVLGMKCRAQVIKNRLGPPLRHADYDMYFDKGIDNYGGWLTVLKEHNLIKQGGAWYTVNYNGKDVKFLSKEFELKLAEVDGLKNYLYDLICDKMVLQYKTANLGIDDVQFTEDVTGDE